jgi:hypothetical protein
MCIPYICVNFARMAYRFPAPIFLITASIMMLHCATALEELVHPLRHQVTAGVPINQLFQRGVLEPRQVSQTCSFATETPCPDGNGCCPDGSPCGYTTSNGNTIGICEGVCPLGAATCTTPITACCPDVGETCGTDGYCTAPPGSLSQLLPSSGGAPLHSSFQGPVTTSAVISSSAPANSHPVSGSEIGASQTVSPQISGSSIFSPMPSGGQATGSQASASGTVPTGGASAAARGWTGWFTALLTVMLTGVQQL